MIAESKIFSHTIMTYFVCIPTEIYYSLKGISLVACHIQTIFSVKTTRAIFKDGHSYMNLMFATRERLLSVSFYTVVIQIPV